MKENNFYGTYKDEISHIIKKYIDIESIRLSQLLKEGNHYQINNNKEAINDLSVAKMLLTSIELIEKSK